MATLTVFFKKEDIAKKIFDLIAADNAGIYQGKTHASLNSFASMRRDGSTIELKSSFYSEVSMQRWIDDLYIVFECKYGFSLYEQNGYKISRLGIEKRKKITAALKELHVDQVYRRKNKLYKTLLNGVEKEI